MKRTECGCFLHFKPRFKFTFLQANYRACLEGTQQKELLILNCSIRLQTKSLVVSKIPSINNCVTKNLLSYISVVFSTWNCLIVLYCALYLAANQTLTNIFLTSNCHQDLWLYLFFPSGSNHHLLVGPCCQRLYLLQRAHAGPERVWRPAGTDAKGLSN